MRCPLCHMQDTWYGWCMYHVLQQAGVRKWENPFLLLNGGPAELCKERHTSLEPEHSTEVACISMEVLALSQSGLDLYRQ
jgi:hypothetical protein